MNINEIIRVVAALNPTQKSELMHFVRQQTTASLDDAVDEIIEELRVMGVIVDYSGDVSDARQRIEALRQLARLL